MASTEGMQMLEDLGYVRTWKSLGLDMETWTYTDDSDDRSWVIMIDLAFGIGSEYRDKSKSSRFMTMAEIEAALTRFSEIKERR